MTTEKNLKNLIMQQPKINVCEKLIVGMGSCVSKHITENGTCVGVPVLK
jgi:hypothetical protein